MYRYILKYNFLKKLYTKFLYLTNPSNLKITDGIIFWRERVFYSLVLFLLFVGVIISILSIFLLSQKYLFLNIIYGIIYAIPHITILSLRNHSFKVKVIIFLNTLFVVGNFFLHFLGSEAYPYLFTMPIFACFFLGIKAGILGIISIIISFVLFYFINYEFLGNAIVHGIHSIDYMFEILQIFFLQIVSVYGINVVSNGFKKTILKKEKVEESLKEQSKKIRTALDKAVASEKLKDEFLIQISHEIRTPLSNIQSFIQLISNERNRISEDEIFFGINSIERSFKRIERTVDLMIFMAELNAGNYIPKPIKINLNEDIIMPIAQKYEPVIDKKGLELIVHINLENCTVISDKFALEVIFDNILNNSIKFTHSGKIEIVCKETLYNLIQIDITDTGIGISKEYVNRIYENFSQEEQGYTRKYDGNGLGLSVVKKYCDKNQIDISIISKKGKGTRVRLKIRRGEIAKVA